MEDETNSSIINSLYDFITEHAFAVFIIILVAYVMRKFTMLFVRRVIKSSLKKDDFKTDLDEKQREDTLISTISAGLRVIIWLLTGLLLLSEFGIDIAPLLAGAGVAGVALGFGAQSMVKDFLAGLFIVLENQYRVGDIIEINQTVSGTVKELTLRHTVLRDLDGMVHSISNGEITIATNMTMEFANVNLDVGVGYNTDLDKLEKIVNKVGTELAEAEDWKDQVIEAPQFRRVNDFGDSAIEIKIVGRTKPMKQWAVTGELRKRLKKAFDKAGIEIPFPQRVIHHPEQKDSIKK